MRRRGLVLALLVAFQRGPIVGAAGDRLFEDRRDSTSRRGCRPPAPIARTRRFEGGGAGCSRARATGRASDRPPSSPCPPPYVCASAGLRPTSARASSTTCSTVNPYSLNTVAPGADAPKRSMPMIAPRRPDPALPAEWRSRLDCEPGGHRSGQHALAILGAAAPRTDAMKASRPGARARRPFAEWARRPR